MADITLRGGLGRPLTNDEVDDNFTNLNNDKLESTDLSVSTGAASGGGTLSYSAGVFTFAPADLSSYVVDLSSFTTTDLAEGTNLYYTNERVDDRVNTLIQAGLGITTSYDDVAGELTIESDTIEELCKNGTGSTILKGTPVYQTGTAGNAMVIAPADASSAATMPAVGVLSQDLAAGAEGNLILMGRISGVDTSAFSEGDIIYVASGGGYTNTRPTGQSVLVQNLGRVTKVHASNGGGVVMGSGRANDVPNLTDGNIFIGNASGTYDKRAIVAADISDLTATATELNYTDGVTSSIQTQLNSKLPSSSYTASDVLTKIKTVDGSGSGLDADLLDGQQGSYYTGYTDTAISNLVDTAPSTLDTLNELAAALGDDANFSTTVTNSIATKVAKAGDSMTGALSISQSTAGTASLSVTNSGGFASNALIAEFVGDSDSIQIRNDAVGDYKILNSQQGNGISIYDGTGGVRLRYNGTDIAGATSSGGFSVLTGGLDVTGSITVSGTVDGRDVATDGTKLDGIESGATADQTAAEILTAIKTVDGTGSGLDADLLDGQQGSYYAAASSLSSYLPLAGGTLIGSLYLTDTNTRISEGNGNTVRITTNSGWVDIGAQNTSYAHIQTDRSKFYFNKAAHFDGQIYNYVGGGTTDPYWRAGNDGAGSGLDADLLDGQQGSYYQPAATALGYVDVATGNYGTIKVDDDRGVSWAGYAIRDDWVFMSNSTGTAAGIYNDTDNEWAIYINQNAGVDLRYNGSVKIATTSAGVDITGTATATTFSGALSGNATTATTLQTARTINGVSFDGSANITVADATKLPLTGGTLTGTLTGTTIDVNAITTGTSQTRGKISVWTTNTYGIGMGTTYTLGGLNGYAMTFQMNTTAGRGFWWGNNGHSNAQGAMSLTNDGLLTVASGMRLGYGQSDTTAPTSGQLDVNGTVNAVTSMSAPIFYDSNNAAYYVNPADTSILNRIYLGSYIYHYGDTNSYLGFSAADDFRIVVGGRQILRCDEGTNPDKIQFFDSSHFIDTNGTLAVNNINEDNYSFTGTALNAVNGGIQYKTLAANTTFTDSLTNGDSMTLRLEGGATYTVTWPTMTWITSGGNVAPTLNGTKDTLVFWKELGVLYGAYVGYGA